jgi:hypothetical protein
MIAAHDGGAVREPKLSKLAEKLSFSLRLCRAAVRKGLAFPQSKRRSRGSPLPERIVFWVGFGSRTAPTTRAEAEMGDPALCWFIPPSDPSDYRSDQIGPSEFPICRFDESDRKSELLNREGN